MPELVSQAKQRFFSALSNIFVGEVGNKLEGNSGYTNLMKIRNEYFKKIKPLIEIEVANEFKELEDGENDLYNKLYTFFDSYLNETGTPFYNKTQLHKNLYEKVYSDKEDLSLFWKTQKLYYVKTETMYTSMKFDLDGITFEFDASEIEHQKGNEKKEIEFHLIKASQDLLKFKVQYKDNSRNRYDRIKSYLQLNTPDKVKDYIFENIDTFEHPNIIINKNEINLTHFKSKTSFRKIVDVKNLDDSLNSVVVTISITNIEDIVSYLKKESISVNEKLINKAFLTYKRQKEVDYFIHKDASTFLKEQFNLFIYNYLFNENELDTLWNKDRIAEIQKLKKIAYSIIDYIALFENELKEIWLKPKFVRNSNYVFTLDRLNNINLIEKIIQSENFDKQIEEWKQLYEARIDEKTGKEIKKEWKEFQFALNFNKNDVIITNEDGTKQLNERYKYLPIDTKYFEDLKYEILDEFEDIDNELNGWLIKGDNFQALNTLLPKYKESVQLIYIDPPFNTGDDFDYKDKFQDSTWLTLMENRIDLSYDLLKSNGSFYLHLDENANYLGRMLMDQKFKKENFRREIIWDIQVLSGFKVAGAEKNWILGHQSIYFYTKSNNYLFNKLIQPHSLKYLESFDKTDNDGRKYQVAHGRRIYKDEVIKKGKPFGDVWNELKDIIDVERPFPEVWEEITAAINFDSPIENVWTDIMSFQQQPTSSERIKFDTQKPEKLLERIIKSGSNPGDIILDFYAGSGTTAATCIKTGRKFITCEIGEHFDTIILPRLKRTILGHETTVSKNNDYKGGGFFKYYELEQYEDVLKNAKYLPTEDNLAAIFYNSEKLLTDVVKIQGNNVEINFKGLYEDVDVAETISNLTGKKIKQLNAERVLFEDGSIVEFKNMTWENHKYLRPLIWWGKSNE